MGLFRFANYAELLERGYHPVREAGIFAYSNLLNQNKVVMEGDEKSRNYTIVEKKHNLDFVHYRILDQDKILDYRSICVIGRIVIAPSNIMTKIIRKIKFKELV